MGSFKCSKNGLIKSNSKEPTYFVRLRLFGLARTKVTAQRADPNPNHVRVASAPNGRFARLFAVRCVLHGGRPTTRCPRGQLNL